VPVRIVQRLFKASEQFSPTRNKKKAFASSKPPPFVPIATKLATTSLSNRDTIFCGQTSLRSSCDTTAELHIFYLKVISKILRVYNFFFAWQQDNDVGLLRRVLGAWFVLVCGIMTETMCLKSLFIVCGPLLRQFLMRQTTLFSRIRALQTLQTSSGTTVKTIKSICYLVAPWPA